MKLRSEKDDVYVNELLRKSFSLIGSVSCLLFTALSTFTYIMTIKKLFDNDNEHQNHDTEIVLFSISTFLIIIATICGGLACVAACSKSDEQLSDANIQELLEIGGEQAANPELD